MVSLIYGDAVRLDCNVKESTENELYGKGWFAIRKQGRCTLGTLLPDQDGGSILLEISNQDFEELRLNSDNYFHIYAKYDRIITDDFTARHTPTKIIFEYHDERGLQSIDINQSDFDCLRQDQKYFYTVIERQKKS